MSILESMKASALREYAACRRAIGRGIILSGKSPLEPGDATTGVS